MEDRKGYLHHHQFGICCCYRRTAKVDSSECQILRTSNKVLLERAVLSVCLCFEGKGNMMLGCARAALKRLLKRIRAELGGIRKKKAARSIQKFQYNVLSYAPSYQKRDNVHCFWQKPLEKRNHARNVICNGCFRFHGQETISHETKQFLLIVSSFFSPFPDRLQLNLLFQTQVKCNFFKPSVKWSLISN